MALPQRFREYGWLAVAGEIVIDCRATWVTVNVVEPETAPTAPVIVVDPLAIPVANPPEDVIVATLVFIEVHAAFGVRSRVLPSL